METRARQLGHMTARMVCGFICVLLMSRFMFYCGFTCVLFMMSFRCVYDSLVFAFMLRLRCFMLVLYVFGLCKALSLRSGSYRRSSLGLPKAWPYFLTGQWILFTWDILGVWFEWVVDHGVGSEMWYTPRWPWNNHQTVGTWMIITHIQYIL